MQFFDRPNRSRIALGGSSSRPPTSQELLARARKAREQRAHQRKRQQSAISVQRAFRTYAAVRSLPARLPVASRPDPQLAVRRLVFFAGLIDRPRAATALNVAALRRAVSARPFLTTLALDVVAALADDAYDPPTLLREYPVIRELLVVKAIVVLLAMVDSAVPSPTTTVTQPQSSSESLAFPAQLVLAVEKLFAALTPLSLEAQAQWGMPSLLKNALLADPAAAQPVVRSLLPAIISQCAHAGVAPHIAAVVRMQLAVAFLAVDDAVAVLALREHPAVCHALIRALGLTVALPTDDSAFAYDFGTRLTEQSLPALAVLCANVSQLTDFFWNGTTTDSKWAFFSALSALFYLLPKHVVSLPDADGDDDDGDDDMNLADDASSLPQYDAAVLRNVVSHVSSSLSRLVSDASVRNLFVAAVAEGHDAVLRVCRLFNFLVRSETRLQVPFQNALAFWGVPLSARNQPHVLASLWKHCQNPDVDPNTSDLPALRPDCAPILSVFAGAYTSLLFVQDVDEMLVSKRPFHKDVMREIALVLKQCLFSTIFLQIRQQRVSTDDRVDRGQLLHSEHGLLDDVARLLSRLRSVDTQVHFTEGEDFWPAGRTRLLSDAFVQDAIEAGPQVLVRTAVKASYGGVRRITYSSGRSGFVSSAGELLRVAPYLVPFTSRSKIFQRWILQERDLANQGRNILNERTIAIRRSHVFEDAFNRMKELGEVLRATIRVQFIDEHGLVEAGIDGGGMFKELMQDLMRLGFSPFSYALFKSTSDGDLYPNSDAAVASENFRDQFRFLGNMLGKAVFNGILVDVPLAKFFRQKMLGEVNYPADLSSLDPELYRNIKFLKNCSPETVEDLGLNFTVASNAFGSIKEVELKRNGRSIAVTASNRIEYIHRLAHYRMNTQIKEQSDAFLRGFYEVVPSTFVQLFSHEELQLLISGKGGQIDLDDLQRNTRYSGGYDESTPVIQWFWAAMAELSPEEQSKMLQFVTSCPRAPLLGFAYLVPGFCIHRAEGAGRLPTASTCMNLLKLPPYESLDTVREKIKYAIQANAGFDLS